MTREETLTWLEAFKNEHGYYPNEDPNLLSKGMSEEDAMNEHKRAKDWGAEHAQLVGRPLTEEDYRHSQPRRYSRTGELVSGFGGFPPEEIEKLQARFAGRGSTPDQPDFSSSQKTVRTNMGFGKQIPLKPLKTWSKY